MIQTSMIINLGFNNFGDNVTLIYILDYVPYDRTYFYHHLQPSHLSA